MSDSIASSNRLSVVGRLQKNPSKLRNRVLDELHMAVAEARVNATGVPAARLACHAPVVRIRTTPHAVAGSDALVPEVRTGLDFIGIVQSIVGRRVTVAAGHDDAGPGK